VTIAHHSKYEKKIAIVKKKKVIPEKKFKPLLWCDDTWMCAIKSENGDLK
jgi:hypothetical protein